MVDTMDVVDHLAARVAALSATTERRVLIGIAGPPGSGKSALAEAVTARLGGFPTVAHVPMDGFHLADVELERLGRADRKGAPDTFDLAGYAALLARIAAGEAVWAPAFERLLEQPIAQAVPVPADARIVISEGNYLLLPQWQAVRRHFDEVWYCRLDEHVRLARLVARHVQFGKTPDEAQRWVHRSDQRNAQLVAATEPDADLVVDLNGVELSA